MRRSGDAVHYKALDTHIEVFHKKMIANSWSTECIAADSTMEATTLCLWSRHHMQPDNWERPQESGLQGKNDGSFLRGIHEACHGSDTSMEYLCCTPIKRWSSKMLTRKGRAPSCKNCNILKAYGLCPLWYQKELTGEGMDLRAQRDDFQGLSHTSKVS